MNDKKEIINRFYSAFQKLDHAAMNDCYSDDIAFNDPVFGLLQGDEVKAMWKMLCSSAKDFSLTYSDIQTDDDEYFTCQWKAVYTFPGTGRKVENRVKAFMRINDNKIVEHTDAFSLSAWMAQALGWKGTLFGWTSLMRKGVQKSARRKLGKFMEKGGPR